MFESANSAGPVEARDALYKDAYSRVASDLAEKAKQNGGTLQSTDAPFGWAGVHQAAHSAAEAAVQAHDEKVDRQTTFGAAIEQGDWDKVFSVLDKAKQKAEDAGDYSEIGGLTGQLSSDQKVAYASHLKATTSVPLIAQPKFASKSANAPAGHFNTMKELLIRGRTTVANFLGRMATGLIAPKPTGFEEALAMPRSTSRSVVVAQTKVPKHRTVSLPPISRGAETPEPPEADQQAKMATLIDKTSTALEEYVAGHAGVGSISSVELIDLVTIGFGGTDQQAGKVLVELEDQGLISPQNKDDLIVGYEFSPALLERVAARRRPVPATI
jgi:hypothetical protein